MKKNLLLRKTTKIQANNKANIQGQILKKKSFFRLNKQNYNQKETDIHQIITNLQKNVKELKKIQYQFSLGKTRVTHSCINMNNFAQGKTIKKNKSQKKIINQKQQINQRQSASKYGYQNGSTMISIHSGDIQQIKKAYFNVYGKSNSNIVELYNFYRKNIQKSTRILGSMQISNDPQFQLSLVKQESNKKYPKRLSNVIVQINNINNKQNLADNQLKSQKLKIIQQIFSRGSSDLINAGSIIKSRPSTGYFRRNLKKQETKVNFKQNVKELIQTVQLKRINFSKQQKNEIGHFQNLTCKIKNKQTQSPENNHQILVNNKMPINFHQKLNKNIQSDLFADKNLELQIKQISQKKLSSRFSQSQNKKSSHKKSSQKKSSHQKSFLNQRIGQFQLSQISQIKEDMNCKKAYINEFQLLPENIMAKGSQDYIQHQQNYQQEKTQKFKRSKYYVSPVPLKKKDNNELQDCSISIKESSRIIELDFIPLDL